MHPSVLLLIAGMFYLILIAILYFGKKKLNLSENKIYGLIIIIGILGIIIDLLGIYSHINLPETSFIRWLVVKLYYAYLFTFVFLTTMYIYYSVNENNNISKSKNIFILIYIIGIMINFILKFDYYNSGNTVYVYGPNSVFLYGISGITMFGWLLFIIKNVKRLKKTKYIPMIAFIIIGIPIAYIQMVHPELLLVTSLITFVIVLMYHTIENPDLKLVKEYKEAKEYAENSNSEKEMFLYNTSRTIKGTIREVNNICEDALQQEKMEDIKDDVKEIKSYLNDSIVKVNKILDINDIEANDNRTMNNAYNPNLIFEQINIYTKKKIKEQQKEIEYINYINKTMPILLNGDSIGIKEIIKQVIDDSLKNTKHGYIEFNVGYIIKEDICRLIITIQDSSTGVEINKLNDIFNGVGTNVDKDEEIDKIIKIKKDVRKIGGTMMLDNKNGGRKITIVIDQQIEIEKDKDLETYEKEYNKSTDSKNIIIVYDDETKSDKLAKQFQKHNISVEVVSLGQKCLERIRNKEEYNLILLDNEIPKLSSTKVLEKLKDIEEFNTPVILLCKEENMILEKRYLDIGFSKLITKPVKNDTIKEIINEYLKD